MHRNLEFRIVSQRIFPARAQYYFTSKWSAMGTVHFIALSLFFVGAYASVCPKIITRKEWDARDPETITYVVFPLDMVVIHHTASPTCETRSQCTELVQNIQNFHLDNAELGDIGYSFLIGGDGNIYEGRGWHKHGAHTFGYNGKSVGIAFIGDFRSVLPTDKAMQAAKDLLACGVELGEITNDYKLYGGKQLIATLSPGGKLYSRIRNWSHFQEKSP
uniref:Peptidoglycan-recognition protein n=1 Tax=Photinus pyralis TaxID=7054 RepID=A0A1Y1M729_PHOPY